MTNTPTLIVMGVTSRVSRALDALHPRVQVIEVHGPDQANDLLTGEYPHAVLCYGPETFPLFSSRQPQFVAAATDQAMLFSNDPGTASAGAGVFDAMDNPEAFVWTAFAALNHHRHTAKLYDVTVPEALEALAELAGA